MIFEILILEGPYLRSILQFLLAVYWNGIFTCYKADNIISDILEYAAKVNHLH